MVALPCLDHGVDGVPRVPSSGPSLDKVEVFKNTENQTLIKRNKLVMAEDTKFRIAVARRLVSHSDTLLDTFLELDQDGSGTVSRKEFKTGMKYKFGIHLSPSQMDLICGGKFGSGTNRIRYTDFTQFIRDTCKTFPLTSSAYGSGLELSMLNSAGTCLIVPDEEDNTNVIRAINRKLRSRATANLPITQMFLSVDLDRDGKISVSDFRDWLEMVGFRISNKKAREILGSEHLDVDGKVDFHGFASFVRALSPVRTLMAWEKLDEESARRERIVASAVARAAKDAMRMSVEKHIDDERKNSELLTELTFQLQMKKTNFVKAFSSFDEDGDGRVSCEEMAKALRDSGMGVSEERARKLIKAFDVTGDGKLAKWEFIQMCTNKFKGDDIDEEEEEEKGGDKIEEDKGDDSNDVSIEDRRKGIYSNEIAQFDDDEDLEIQQAVDNLDVDDVELLREFRKLLNEEKRKLRKTFQAMDKNGNKKLSTEEMKEGFTRLGLKCDDAVCSKLVQKFDLDGSGDIAYYEFVRMI